MSSQEEMGARIDLYRKLLLVREAEKKIQEEYVHDEMKTPVHLGIGAEAIAVGVCSLLPKNTKVFGTYRNHAIYLALTEDTDSFFGELYGKVTGCAKGKAGSMHLSCPEKGLVATSAVVGTTIPVAVGAALANAYRGSDDLVVVFFGDGATEEGAFWESLNFACLRGLRMLFVCENNELAIHAPQSERQARWDLSRLASEFGCFADAELGYALDRVAASTGNMLRRIGSEKRPGLLHFTYYRFLEHVGIREDFDAGYRKKPPREKLDHMDPVKGYEQELLMRGCSEDALMDVYRAVRAQIDASVEKAKKAPFPTPEELWKDVLV